MISIVETKFGVGLSEQLRRINPLNLPGINKLEPIDLSKRLNSQNRDLNNLKMTLSMFKQKSK